MGAHFTNRPLASLHGAAEAGAAPRAEAAKRATAARARVRRMMSLSLVEVSESWHEARRRARRWTRLSRAST